MKRIGYLLLIAFQLLSLTIDAQKSSSSSIQIDTTVLTKKIENDVIKRIEVLENQKSFKEDLIAKPFEYGTFVTAILTLILALFLGWASYLSYGRINEAKQIVKEAQDKLDLFDENAKKKIDELDREIEKYDKQVMLLNKNLEHQIDDFSKEIETKGKEIKIICDKSYEIEKEVKSMHKELSKNQNYIKESIENIFEALYWIANNKGDKDQLNIVFLRRAISNLYSMDKALRFLGISVLREHGNMSDIRHLENIQNNPDESVELRQIASDAIVRITLRSNENKNTTT